MPNKITTVLTYTMILKERIAKKKKLLIMSKNIFLVNFNKVVYSDIEKNLMHFTRHWKQEKRQWPCCSDRVFVRPSRRTCARKILRVELNKS